VVARLATPFELDGHHVIIGASIGIAVAPSDGLDAEQLLKNADTALYRAKNLGGGRVCCFEPEMDREMVTRRALASDVGHALEAGQFVLFYQPIVDIKTRGVVAFEALIRWQHPKQGLISPELFIPLAEENGLIMPIDDWVLREACKQATRWPDGQKVSVNISAISFTNPTIVDRVAKTLHASGLDPERLILELTETIMLRDAETALATLHSLRDLGVRVALDDFGTGYSSLNYLQRFPFHKVKIDRAFVANLDKNHQSVMIIRAVIELCDALGMLTVAEGVETAAQYEVLAAQGCQQAQGFLINRPLPPELLPGFLASPLWHWSTLKPEAA
jgi:predicted signal transduction protein with EAL and GGDEF domain